MRSLLFSALVLVAGAAHAADPIPVDDFALSDYAGRVVYLDFWASWCVPCRLSFPWMIDMQTKYASQGLQVIAVNLDSDAAAAARFLAQFDPDFPIVLDPDGTLAEQRGVGGMPNSFLFDRAGRLAAHHEGFRRSDTQALEHLLVQQLGAQP